MTEYCERNFDGGVEVTFSRTQCLLLKKGNFCGWSPFGFIVCSSIQDQGPMENEQDSTEDDDQQLFFDAVCAWAGVEEIAQNKKRELIDFMLNILDGEPIEEIRRLEQKIRIFLIYGMHADNKEKWERSEIQRGWRKGNGIKKDLQLKVWRDKVVRSSRDFFQTLMCEVLRATNENNSVDDVFDDDESDNDDDDEAGGVTDNQDQQVTEEETSTTETVVTVGETTSGVLIIFLIAIVKSFTPQQMVLLWQGSQMKAVVPLRTTKKIKWKSPLVKKKVRTTRFSLQICGCDYFVLCCSVSVFHCQ